MLSTNKANIQAIIHTASAVFFIAKKGGANVHTNVDKIAESISKRGITRDASPLEKRVAKALKIAARAKDEEVWRTSEEGRHFQIESETGTITKGFGGKLNGAKVQPKAKKSGVSGASKSGKKSSGSSDLGELVNTYKDGTKGYQKKGVDLTPEEHKEWMYPMESWVKSEAYKQLQEKGYERRDIDFNVDRDAGTATIKTWKKDSKSPSGLTNEYFKVHLTGTRTTNVRPDGSKRSYVNPDGVKLEFAGSELY